MEDARALIFEILHQAVSTPSGDNCQPWIFDVNENRLQIFADHRRANHVLDGGGFASLLSLGALIETIETLAQARGYIAELIFLTDLPIALDGSVWCKLLFTKRQDLSPQNAARYAVRYHSRQGPVPAETFIDRCTDRRRFHGFDRKALALVLKDASEGFDVHAHCQVHLLEQMTDQLSAVLARCESALFDIEGAVEGTTKWIRLSQKDAHHTLDGLPIRNLGVGIVEAAVFIAVGRFSRLSKFLHPLLKFAMRRKIDKQLREATLIGFSSTEITSRSLVDVGRLAMRTWLLLTVEKYGVQPMTLSSLGTIILKAGHFGEVAPEVAEPFARVEPILANIFGLGNGRKLVWIFRVGKTLTPLPLAARTLRRPPVFRK